MTKNHFKDPTKITSQPLKNLLPPLLKKLSTEETDYTLLFSASWSNLVGPRFASLCSVTSFDRENGTLFIMAQNASVKHLLFIEKIRLFAALKALFPQSPLKTLHFYVGK